MFLHILNGQLMSVMVDDDPGSSNNWSGQFGIEIERTTRRGLPGRRASDGRMAEKLEQGDRLETEEKVAHR
jgi:hypothetical protein